MTPRVLVTRPDGQSATLEAALRAHGIEPVVVAAIAVEIDPSGGPLDVAARRLASFSWVVVTSATGGRAIVEAAERVRTDPRVPRWAAIGGATADLLESEGIPVAFRPSRANGPTLAAELPIDPGQEVLIPRGNLAGDELARRLRARGAAVTDVVAYRTIEGPDSSRPLLHDALRTGRPDAVLFASGSAVRGLVALAGPDLTGIRQVPAVCIGPETAREATRTGFQVIATAVTPDAEALAVTTAAALAQPLETR